MKEWYQDATSVPNGHLLIDLTPKTVDSLRYCSNSGSTSTKFCLTAGIETKFSDDEYKIRHFSPKISKIFPKASKTIHSHLPKRFHPVSEQLFSKPIMRRASRSSERRRCKISKTNSDLTQKRTPLHKRRIFLRSTKGLQLISIISPFVI